MQNNGLSRFSEPRFRTRRRRWSARSQQPALPWYASLKVTPMIMPKNRKLPDPEIRAGLVARVRREIEAGTYDTPEKLEIALQRMFDCIAEDAERTEADPD
jgi:hypothetical protein